MIKNTLLCIHVVGALMDCSMAFNKCLFSKLFQKMLDKGVPVLVVRVLSFIYEEQSGCVRLVGESSEPFSLTNGTRQGSVLSPVFSASIWMDCWKNYGERNWAAMWQGSVWGPAHIQMICYV